MDSGKAWHLPLWVPQLHMTIGSVVIFFSTLEMWSLSRVERCSFPFIFQNIRPWLWVLGWNRYSLPDATFQEVDGITSLTSGLALSRSLSDVIWYESNRLMRHAGILSFPSTISFSLLFFFSSSWSFYFRRSQLVFSMKVTQRTVVYRVSDRWCSTSRLTYMYHIV